MCIPDINQGTHTQKKNQLRILLVTVNISTSKDACQEHITKVTKYGGHFVSASHS